MGYYCNGIEFEILLLENIRVSKNQHLNNKIDWLYYQNKNTILYLELELMY